MVPDLHSATAVGPDPDPVTKVVLEPDTVTPVLPDPDPDAGVMAKLNSATLAFCGAIRVVETKWP